MQRRDYVTIAIALKRAKSRFLLDKSLSIEEINGGEKMYNTTIDALIENIKIENSAFDRDKFMKSLES